MRAARQLLGPLWARAHQGQRHWTQEAGLRVAGRSAAVCSTSTPAPEGEQLILQWQRLLQEDQVPGLPTAHTQHLKQLLHAALRVHGKQAPSAVLPEQATVVWMQAYKALTHSDDAAKQQFFWLLCRDFGVQANKVDAAVANWQKQSASCAAGAAPQEALLKAAERLQAAVKPLYLQLLLPVSQHAQGITFLLDMRSDLLRILRAQPSHATALRALSEDLRCALAEWFTTGLLQLQRVTWESSAALLEKVASSEAVHGMGTWQQLKQRLGPNRRVFCFLHPSLPGEPLVVLHTAIMHTIPADMHSILHPAAPQAAQLLLQQLPAKQQQLEQQQVACFYSISSTQPGLSGVDLGNSLIKRVAQLLLAELPQLQHLVTLSPIPGFKAWLVLRLQQEAAAAGDATESKDATLLLEADLLHLAPLVQQHVHDRQRAVAEEEHGSAATVAKALLHLMQDERWLQHAATLRPVLMRLAAVYLLHERRRNNALDSVANFHLRNGAWLWRLNWKADTTPAGHQRSFGIMVNYMYVLEDVQKNNRAYLMEHKIAASPAMLALAAGAGE